MAQPNIYEQLIERVFLDHYTDGAQVVDIEREDLSRVANEMGVRLPKNVGDVLYSFRYRRELPEAIRSRAPKGKSWKIVGSGPGRYQFVAAVVTIIKPNPMLVQIKVPNATPGIIERYALNDEQAILAKLRYNRLIDVFTGVTCYSLQSHLRTAVKGMGQVETDELYVGVDRRGAHYVLPVQAKGRKDKLNIVQIEQDFLICQEKFSELICRAIAAQFVEDNLIALFAFENGENGVRLACERHYRLVQPGDMTDADLRAYRESILEE